MTAQAKTPAAGVRRLGYVYMPMGSDITRWTPHSEHDLSELSGLDDVSHLLEGV